MADSYSPTLVSKSNEVNSATNPIFTEITDGTDTLAVNADGSINVTVTGGASNTQYAEDTAAVSGDIGTVALVVRKDAIGSNVSADGDYATLLQDANGRLYTQIHDGGNSITVDGTVTVTQATGTNLHAVIDSGSIAVNNASGAAAVNIQDGGNSITVDGTVAVSSVAGNVTVVQPTGTNLHVVVDSGAITVSATDLDIRDLSLAQDAVKVSGNSSANSLTNPIFVQLANAIISGEVHDYNTAAAVAAGASSNHDYTVVTAFKLKSVKFANSGGMKVEVQVGPVASLVSKYVGFIPLAGGSDEVTFDPPIEVPTTSTGTVRVIRTNRNFVAVDVYSTIVGVDA